MQRAAIAFALFGAAFAATPAQACFSFTACHEETVYVAPYEADLPPPAIFEIVKRREDGGLSLAGFYNEPYAAPTAERVSAEPSDVEPEVIYSPWGHPHRHAWDRRERYRTAHFHAHIRRD